MTRHLLSHMSNYGIDPTMEYRQSARYHPSHMQYEVRDRAGFNLARPNPRADPIRQSARPDLVPHQVSPAGLQDRNASGTPRRRIPVACGRCRKRKIRCSGDPGDNTGCQNCKQAGIPQGTCVFLRVQSEPAENLTNHILMKAGLEQVSSSNIDMTQYSSSSAASSSSSLGMMHHASVSTPTLHSTLGHSQQPIRMSGSSVAPLGLSNTHGLPTKSLYHDPLSSTDASTGLMIAGARAPYEGLGDLASGNGLSGGNDSYSTFPQYMLPDLGHGLAEAGNAGLSNTQERGLWARGTGNMVVDQDSTSSMNSLSNYIPTTNTRASGVEGYPLFPALHTLSSSLPDGLGSRASLSEKSLTTLPPPIRTQSADVGSSRSPNVPLNSSPGNYVPSSPSGQLATSEQSASSSMSASTPASYSSSGSHLYPTSCLPILSSSASNSASILSASVETLSNVSLASHKQRNGSLSCASTTPKVLATQTPKLCTSLSSSDASYSSQERRNTLGSLRKVC